MQDAITKLCRKLVWAEDPEIISPVSERLQKAIHERVERVRETAMEIVMIDRMVNLDAVSYGQSEENCSPSRQHSG